MKKINVVYTMKQAGKYYSVTDEIIAGGDIIAAIHDAGKIGAEIVDIDICLTKKEAERTAEGRNKIFKENGTNYFY